MIHPPSVREKAQRLESLLQRLEAGKPLEQVCIELGLSVEAQDVPKLQAKYEAGGRKWGALIDGRYGHPQKAHSALREWLYERKREDKALTARELVLEIAEQFQVELSIGHVNYLLRKVGLTRPRGQPRRRGERSEVSPASATRPDESPDNSDSAASPQAPSSNTREAPTRDSLDHAGLFFPRGGEAGDGGGRDCGDEPGGGRGVLSGGKP